MKEGAMPDNATHAISLDSIHLQLAESYAALSPQLKRAASYVLEHPAEMAFQSIRKRLRQHPSLPPPWSG
ncbi:hypothetical protein DK37_05700 [Halomonas sp. SUBG004]|nr:hypothetical protein DK37_05700 [Halomonas sp. SUBG004]